MDPHTEVAATEAVHTVIKVLFIAVSHMAIRGKVMAIINLVAIALIHTRLLTVATDMMMTMAAMSKDVNENMIETNGRKTMTKQHTPKIASTLSIAILLAISSARSWADGSQLAIDQSHSYAQWDHARQVSKQKQQQLVKEAVEAVMETENALTDLSNKKPKEAQLKLNTVSAKLQTLLAKNSQLKLVPVSFQEQTFMFKGSLDDIKAATNKANELIEDQRIQEARQLLDQLTSEIRINVLELPLNEYPAAIDKAKSLIAADKPDDAANTLADVLDKMVAHVEIYPLPVLAAETDLTEAYELEHKTDISKPESKDSILKLADHAEIHLKVAEALGYGEKQDYEELYQGIQALRETLHTDKFKTEWDKVKTTIGQLKERVMHSVKNN